MDSMAAYVMCQVNKFEPQKAFDWDKAAEILRDRQCLNARAGLQRDMEWTAGEILKNGEIYKEDYTFLSSNWAIPVLEIGDEEIPCWRYASESGYSADTKWPASAVLTFKGVGVGTNEG